MTPIICILAAWFPLYILCDKVIYQLQSNLGRKWTDARANCFEQMAFVDHTFPFNELQACLSERTKIYVGNVKLISPPLSLLGCFPLNDGQYKDLMNTSRDIQRSAVALCFFKCKDATLFAIQDTKCKCLNSNFTKPLSSTFGNTSSCEPCKDNMEDICGGIHSAAIYEKFSINNLHFNENEYDKVCITQRLSQMSYASCTQKNGKCHNGQTFNNSTWIGITLCCARQNSIISNIGNNDSLINLRRYSIEVPESYFVQGFPNGLNDEWSPLFGYILNGSELHFLPNSDLAEYSLCLKDNCSSSAEFQCQKKCAIPNTFPTKALGLTTASSTYHTRKLTFKNDVIDSSPCGSSTHQTKIELTVTKMRSTNILSEIDQTVSTFQEQTSNWKTGFDTSTTIYTSKNVASQRNVQTNNAAMNEVDSSTAIISSTQHVNRRKEERNTSLAAYVSIPACVLAISLITLGVFILRRKSRTNSKAGSLDPDTKEDDMEKAKEVKGRTAAGIPEYAVVYKPKKEKRVFIEHPDGVNNTGMNEDEGHDHEGYYVSNDEDYDHIRNRRKINRSNSLENEYNVAEVGTFENDIYSLAKPIDEDEQTEETYDASFSVHTDLISVTVDDTYDHSSPL